MLGPMGRWSAKKVELRIGQASEPIELNSGKSQLFAEPQTVAPVEIPQRRNFKTTQFRVLLGVGVCLVQVSTLVTTGAKGNQILFNVVSQPAPRTDMMNLELSKTAAVLAAPPIALQHLLAKSAVGLGVEAEPGPGATRKQRSHEAFLSCSRNSCLCG